MPSCPAPTSVLRLRRRKEFQVWKLTAQSALTGLFGLAALASAIWPTWLEGLTGLEPDGGSGDAEWWLVLALGVAAVVSGVYARQSLVALRAAAVESR